MPVLRIDHEINFEVEFPRFLGSLKQMASVRPPPTETINGHVWILKHKANPKEMIPSVAIRYQGDIIYLYLSYNSLYLYGFKVNDYPWYSLNRDPQNPHFPGGVTIGFDEDYRSLGASNSLSILGRIVALRKYFKLLFDYSVHYVIIAPSVLGVHCLQNLGDNVPFTNWYLMVCTYKNVNTALYFIIRHTLLNKKFIAS